MLDAFSVCCGPNRCNVGTVKCCPVGSRSYLARPLADGTASGKKAWGCSPHTPGRGESPAPSRKLLNAISRMLWFHRCHGGTVKCCPVGSRSYLARPSADGTASGKRAWGCSPHTPGRGESPAPSRKLLNAISRMLWFHRCHVGTVRKAVPDPRPVP